mmetsp:Transcript_9418/g.20072  ORF Transcript_9418/g.20072 Transcript_9418/m.20072 type:complete len:312 (+) Transcript_9418:80-1015(+)
MLTMNTRTSARTGLSSRAPLRSSRVTYSRSRLACNAKVNVEQLKAAQEELRTYIQSKYCNPIIVRLAWHDSGTYNKEVQGWPAAGGANGSIRFQPEIGHAANAGLKIAIGLLNPIKKKFPEVSYADLYQLASAVAVEVAGGPKIPMRYGRKDVESAEGCSPDGNLPSAGHPFPDGSVSPAEHLRKVFYRMGFNDQEIVALVGAHTLGRCHTDRSGFVNPWTNAPTTFSNLYFQELKNNKWTRKKWNGPMQYEDKSGQLMMLPADMALLWDRGFRKYVDLYAKDENKFFEDFAAAFSKLLELGVAFPATAQA